mmetsp:Transcript_14181/g.28036  ORF Transcript_14181/g.28036 Transcript_14181/m.28036 type:complete len:220 (+) Transcript_14181:304-963(+)
MPNTTASRSGPHLVLILLCSIELADQCILKCILFSLYFLCAITHSLHFLAILKIVHILVIVEILHKLEEVVGLLFFETILLSLCHCPQWLRRRRLSLWILNIVNFCFSHRHLRVKNCLYLEGIHGSRLSAVLDLPDKFALFPGCILHPLLAQIVVLLAFLNIHLILSYLRLQFLYPLAVSPQRSTWPTGLHSSRTQSLGPPCILGWWQPRLFVRIRGDH